MKFNSKVNAITLILIAQLALIFRSANIGTQIIHSFTLEIPKMISIRFWIWDKEGKNWSLEEIFLLPDSNMKVILGMPFLFFDNMNIGFEERLSEKLI